MKKSDLFKGKKVYYDTDYKKENGIVKSIASNGVFVVYHWSDEPENFENYTGQLTPISSLSSGWVLSESEEEEFRHLNILVENGLTLAESQKLRLDKLNDLKFKPFGKTKEEIFF